MRLHDRRVLLTGATGGIGSALASQLVESGARVALAGRRQVELDELALGLDPSGRSAFAVVADLADPTGPAFALAQATKILGGVDILINNAGVSEFTRFADSSAASLEAMVRCNLLAPMLLARAALPAMLQAGEGVIVNIGSSFGAIAFPYFSSYSATKFGMRGFSEALWRELADSGVPVLYVAPRATRTALNSAEVYRMGQQTGMRFDSPDWVAESIVSALREDSEEVHLGWPERFFVRLNELLPRLVDKALRKQDTAMARHVGKKLVSD